MKILSIIWTSLVLILAPSPAMPETYAAHVQDCLEEVMTSGATVKSSKRASRLPRKMSQPRATNTGANVERGGYMSYVLGTRSVSLPLHILNRTLLI